MVDHDWREFLRTEPIALHFTWSGNSVVTVINIGSTSSLMPLLEQNEARDPQLLIAITTMSLSIAIIMGSATVEKHSFS